MLRSSGGMRRRRRRRRRKWPRPPSSLQARLPAAVAQSSGGCQRGADTAQLTWVVPTINTDGAPLTDLAGYTISFGLSPTSLSQSVNVTDPSATSYTVMGLSPGTWYFEISAYSSAGTQSAPSNTANKTIG